MGIFDKNIHMNGAGTTYQAFLDLADAAEEKGGTIGDRTVRLVKAGDGLATTTSSGTKGVRAEQIADARNAFLQAIAREYGYAARDIAAKMLGDEKDPVPLTARSIRAVNEALGDKDALAADSALIRQFKGDFEIEVVASFQLLESRMGTTPAELDRGKIQAEVIKLIKEGTYPNTKDGMREAVRNVAAQRVAVAMRMESLFRARGVPEYMVPRLAAMVLDKAMAIVDDYKVRSGDDVIGKLHTLATNFAMESKDFIDRCNIAEATADEAENLLKTMFGPNALDGEDAAKALENLKSKLDKLQDKKMSMEEFETECDNAFKLTVKAHIVRQIGMEMMLANSSASYGRMGVRLYDALGVGNGENDRAIDDFCILKMPSDKVKNYAGLDAKSPEELRRQAAKFVLGVIVEDYVGKLPPVANGHPNLDTTKFAVAHTVVRDFVDRFASAVTDDDFAKLAEDFKAQLAQQFERVNTTLKNIDIAKEQAKGELEGKLQQIADQYGISLTQGIKDMFASTLVEATDKLLKDAHSVDKALAADECKAAILDRIEKKWLSLCRQAATEIESSALDPAQKKAFLAKVMAGNVDVTHVKIALKTVAAFDAKELADAAKAGDGKKLAEQLFQFVVKTNAMITDKADIESVKGADDYTAFVGTATDLFFVIHPEIADGIRGLDAGPRAKLFDDAVEASIDKSRELQNRNRDGLTKLQELAMGLEARHWSAATSCVMQLNQLIA